MDAYKIHSDIISLPRINLSALFASFVSIPMPFLNHALHFPNFQLQQRQALISVTHVFIVQGNRLWTVHCCLNTFLVMCTSMVRSPLVAATVTAVLSGPTLTVKLWCCRVLLSPLSFMPFFTTGFRSSWKPFLLLRSVPCPYRPDLRFSNKPTPVKKLQSSRHA